MSSFLANDSQPEEVIEMCEESEQVNINMDDSLRVLTIIN